MESNDLQTLWQRYDEKLDRIESLNRRIIGRMISRKTGFKLNFLKFQSIYTVLLAPVIFLVVVLPFAQKMQAGPLCIAGLVMVILMLINGMYFGARMFSLLKKIHIDLDSLVVTKQKLLAVRRFFIRGYKNGYWAFYLGSAGLIMMMWPMLVRIKTVKVLIFYAVFFTLVPIWSEFLKKIYLRKLYGKMERELDELREYQIK